MAAVSKPHNTATGPPEGSANDNEAASAVQLFKIAKAYPLSILPSQFQRSKASSEHTIPSIATGLKCRFSSDSCPVIFARWSASDVELIGESPIVDDDEERAMMLTLALVMIQRYLCFNTLSM
jgi:hypothetical protein